MRASEGGVCDQRARDHRRGESQLADRGRREGGGAKEAKGGDERERTDGGNQTYSTCVDNVRREVRQGATKYPTKATRQHTKVAWEGYHEE